MRQCFDKGLHREGLHRPLCFALGVIAAISALTVVAETFLWVFPPKGDHVYAGEDSPIKSIYRTDPDFAVTYKSWEAFRSDNKVRLEPFSPFYNSPDDRKTWAFFGNSFVQAPGMLADLAREKVADRRIFNLGKNEELYVRLAQIKLLLEHGFSPERIFFVLLPIDMLGLGSQPLNTVYVTSKGALTFRPSLPDGALGWLLRHSPLARSAWFLSGYHRGNPHFKYSMLWKQLDDPLLSDLLILFSNLSRLAKAHRVPVTIILMPSYEQVMLGKGFAFQETLGALLTKQGYDVFDARNIFGPNPRDQDIFVPDKHFSRLGNEILLEKLMEHLGESRHRGVLGRRVDLP